MRTALQSLKWCCVAAGWLLFSAGCGTTDGGSGSVGMYYGVGFYDPWYHGGYCDDPDVIVTPPERPENRPRPEHPIVKPPPAVAQPRPMPSIPSTPRVSARGGGRR